jgi:hypothetical protein
MTDEERQSIRDRLSSKLNRRLSLRPTPEELEARNILTTKTQEELMIEKEQKKQILDRKVSTFQKRLDYFHSNILTKNYS